MPSPVADLLAALAAAFEQLGLSWYLFGAQAVVLYGGPRLTADVDVTVALGDRPTSALVETLAAAGFRLRGADVAGFVERTRVLPAVHEGTGMPVDVVLAGAGPEEVFLSARATTPGRRSHRPRGGPPRTSSPWRCWPVD